MADAVLVLAPGEPQRHAHVHARLVHAAQEVFREGYLRLRVRVHLGEGRVAGRRGLRPLAEVHVPLSARLGERDPHAGHIVLRHLLLDRGSDVYPRVAHALAAEVRFGRVARGRQPLRGSLSRVVADAGHQPKSRLEPTGPRSAS